MCWQKLMLVPKKKRNISKEKVYLLNGIANIGIYIDVHNSF
jgi:hypothetical protein